MRKTLLIPFLATCVFFLFAAVAEGRDAHIKDYAKPGDNVTEVLQRLISQYSTIMIDEGRWYISPGIKLRSGITICGKGQGKSVLVRDNRVPMSSGMFFYTELANPDVYVNNDPIDSFHANSILYENIKFQDLTLDFNRSPERYSDKELKNNNIYGIAFIRAENCLIERCSFEDKMTKDCNNGYPAVVVFQSANVHLRNNHSKGMTFLQVINSKKTGIESNLCENSVGTAIETIGGYGHRCNNNVVTGAYWAVSCVGINSLNCRVLNNNVTSDEHNISCLTIGHEGRSYSATKTIVKHNVLHSRGCRSLIVQNGERIIISQNDCSCFINEDSPMLTSGCIVASGNAKGITGMRIERNNLKATGDGTWGCITYRGSGTVSIKNNDIEAKKGVSILTSNNGTAIIQNNSIKKCDSYSIQANCHKLVIGNNHLSDGIVTTARDIEIRGNRLEGEHCSFLGTRWEDVLIENNTIGSNDNIGSKNTSAFLLDCTDKDRTYDEKRIKVRKNTIQDESKESIVSFSSTINSPQISKSRISR